MVAGLDAALSVSALQELLAECTGVPVCEQELLTGFPPAVRARALADRFWMQLGSWQGFISCPKFFGVQRVCLSVVSGSRQRSRLNTKH